jgi:hypothetical protein
MAERGTPDLNFESGPVHSGIGSKIGYRHHQPRRPAFIPDAKEIPATSQVPNGKKMALRLRKKHSPQRHRGTEKTKKKEKNLGTNSTDLIILGSFSLVGFLCASVSLW